MSATNFTAGCDRVTACCACLGDFLAVDQDRRVGISPRTDGDPRAVVADQSEGAPKLTWPSTGFPPKLPLSVEAKEAVPSYKNPVTAARRVTSPNQTPAIPFPFPIPTAAPMALPHATVASLAALRALAVVVDAVRLAPDYLDVLEEKKAEGWMCGQQARIREVARFAALLGELDGKVIPALNLDASNEVMRRRLGTIGDALRRISSRYSLLPPPDLVRLARPLSTFLIVASREAKQSVSRFGELLVDINGHVQSSLDSRVDLEALPTVRVASLLDLQALSGVVDAHEIHVRAVHAVCHARDYHNFVLEKKSTGWRCAQETKVRKIAGFATLLLELSDDIIPNLKDDPSNIRLIRRLRSRGTIHDDQDRQG